MNTPDPADVHTGTDRVELTDAEKWLIPHLTQLDAAADARDVYAAVGSIVAARLQALTAERDNFEANCAHWMKSYEQQTEFARQMTGERDAARAELASANARCAELEAQKVADHETWLQEVEERDAMLIERDATLDRVTALADEWEARVEEAHYYGYADDLRAALTPGGDRMSATDDRRTPYPDCAARNHPHGPHQLAGPGGNKPGAYCDGLSEPDAGTKDGDDEWPFTKDRPRHLWEGNWTEPEEPR